MTYCTTQKFSSCLMFMVLPPRPRSPSRRCAGWFPTVCNTAGMLLLACTHRLCLHNFCCTLFPSHSSFVVSCKSDKQFCRVQGALALQSDFSRNACLLCCAHFELEPTLSHVMAGVQGYGVLAGSCIRSVPQILRMNKNKRCSPLAADT